MLHFFYVLLLLHVKIMGICPQLDARGISDDPEPVEYQWHRCER